MDVHIIRRTHKTAYDLEGHELLENITEKQKISSFSTIKYRELLYDYCYVPWIRILSQGELLENLIPGSILSAIMIFWMTWIMLKCINGSVTLMDLISERSNLNNLETYNLGFS